MTLPALVQAMLETAFYPQPAASVELRQTHISYVFLAGGDVFKVKKPVRFSFLDFSTLERRRHFCHEEVRLNRRLAPDVYLGVVAVCSTAGGFRLGDENDPAAIEYAVHMRRLPDERTLEHLLEHGEVAPEAMDRLAALLVDFHRRAQHGAEITANGDPAAVLRILQDNFDGVRPFRGTAIEAADDDSIQDYARSFLDENAALLHRRQREQRIRDGHGDLHTDHVYLTESPAIVDCVEFNPLYRWCDVASDLAFLAMDIDYHGRPDLSMRLVERYAALSGDAELRRLLPFYACYRAYVRGKVDSLKSAEEEVEAEERERARAGARRHFALAYRYTWADRPRLVTVAGLSGTGKSSVARALAERTGFLLIGSDAVRKELAGLAPTSRAGGSERDVLYGADMSRRTYAELLARAARALGAGRGVILDATFQLRAGRDAARQIAAATGAPFLLVECRSSDAIVRRRLEERVRRGNDVSDANWAVYLEQKLRFQAFADDEQRVVLDTSESIARLVAEVERALRRARR